MMYAGFPSWFWFGAGPEDGPKPLLRSRIKATGMDAAVRTELTDLSGPVLFLVRAVF